MSGITLTEQDDADIPTPPTGKATIFLDDTVGPAYKDDVGVVTSLEGAPGADAPPLSYVNQGNTGSTETVDASASDVHRLVANAATVTLTLTGAPASGTVGIVRLYLEQDGTGGRDWVFPGSVVWGVAGEPDWTTRAAGDIDLVDLMTIDGGTTWVAAIPGREGPQGAPGAGSGTVTTVEEVDASPTDSAVTKIVFPNGTLGIAAHVATYTPIVKAPTAAKYLVGDLDTDLSAEKVKAALYRNYDPDEYPTSGLTLSDEFDDSSLDAAWTWDTAPGGTVSETTYPGFLYLTGGTDASGTVRHLRRAFVPGAAAFSVVAKMNLAVENGNFNSILGIKLLDSSDGVAWQVLLAGDGTVTASDGYRITSTASTWITAATVPLITAPQYLLVTRSAANVYKGYVSSNGLVWQYIGTSTVATTVAKVAIAYGVDTDALDDDASVDFLRVFTTETKKIGA